MKTLATGIAGLILLGAGSMLNAAEKEKSPHCKLPPARSLIGKWKTPLYVTFYTQMDSSRGVFEDVITEKRNITWIITKGLNANTVNIRQTYKSKDYTVLDTGILIPPVPGNSPYLVGKISGTRLTVKDWSGRKCGNFTFTSDHMQGAWDRTETVGIYTVDRVYTKKKELKLLKK